eukprot:jgi/Mesvir1/21643/Mv04064-RA.1
MAERATEEHSKYAASYKKGVVNLPQSSDVEVDLDKLFENPLGPIRPYIRTKKTDNRMVLFRAKDIGVYITESLQFKGVDDEAVEAMAQNGGVAYNHPAREGGLHISKELVKPFILQIPCHPDNINKRVAMCNHLLKIVGADAIVHKSEITLSAKHKSGFAKDTNLLKREAGRREVQLNFTIAWCEDVLSNYSRVLKQFDNDDGQAKREFYDLARKMDRAEVLYPEAVSILEKLSRVPLPLKSVPAWVRDVDRVRESEIPKVDSDTENQLLRADLAMKEDKCAKLECELADLRASLEKIKLANNKTDSQHKPEFFQHNKAALPPAQGVRHGVLGVQAIDAFQTSVRFLLDGLRHQLTPDAYAVVNTVRDMWNGETSASYHDRVEHTLLSMSMFPPVARAFQMLYSCTQGDVM